MTILLNQEDRFRAVLEGVLPADILSDDDMIELQQRVMEAIMKKLSAPIIINQGNQVIQ